ncbi:DUF2267 domain-containing protein [Geodermatophilus ruber]|uniref:Uncharacterized conserved protein, DUF2267 family n=1 Tax=Geodermatophilus ruber TaxID=504800 RepID=A0A1I4AZT7_9ACTN|nr:DUF2267 domain-containing protein [Geodermatophilus ruber]SFK61106.1 Uncharacterized conserved protein, DUF2267 family [Geodermatophilus ruber]
MEYDEFIDRVAERAGVSREQAAVLTQATLAVLADRISGGQAADLEVQLPEKLARPLRKSPQKPAEKYGFAEFVEKVRDRAVDVPPEAILPGIRAVMLTLRDAVAEKEFRDTLAQLPHEFREMLQEERRPEVGTQESAESGGDRTAGAAARGGQRAGGPAPAVSQDDALVQRTAERAGFPAAEAAELTRATLSVLGDRIGGQQAHDLAQRLPDASAQWLDEPPDTPAQDYGVEDFVSRVRDLTNDVPDDDITPGIQAVLIALRDAAGETEVDIALQPLSDDYDVLVQIS